MGSYFSTNIKVKLASTCLTPLADERFIKKWVKEKSAFLFHRVTVPYVGSQTSECVCVCVGKKRREVLPLRMLPVWLLSPPWTLLACCFSKQKGPEMIQDKHTATAAHPGAKVRTTNLQTHMHPHTLNPPNESFSRLTQEFNFKTGTHSAKCLTKKIQSIMVIVESRKPFHL